MINLTINDPTQRVILEHLAVTEELLADAATKASGKEQFAQVWAMPDLGLPRNIGRIHGGFYTGALYQWETSTPIVPIDATVNCCGVSVFRIDVDIDSHEEFLGLIRHAITNTSYSSYNWNFATGNHFVIYGEVESGNDALKAGKYAVLHSSASEFKTQYNGLYPVANNWYYHHVQTIRNDSKNRYLRYIEGKVAEQFGRIAAMLETFNRVRHRYFVSEIFGATRVESEVINYQHYGMPSQDSVAIGCQWLSESDEIYLLLTRPGEPLYFVAPKNDGRNVLELGEKRILTPHGLGAMSPQPLSICYRANELYFNGRTYELDAKLEIGTDIVIRELQDSSLINTPPIVLDILNQCPGEVIGSIRPIFSYNRLDA